MQQTNSLHYFLPMLWHRHIEIALCSHEHRDLETANQCLKVKKQSFDELLQDPNLPKRLRKRYENTVFLVRRITLEQTWTLVSQHNCFSDGSMRGHWQNGLIGLMHLPMFSFAYADAKVPDLISKIDFYHDTPKRRSKNRPKAPVEERQSLNEFLNIKTPDYLKEVNKQLGKVG